MTFDELVASAGARGASDIHLRAGQPPLVRIGGALERWTSVAAVTAPHLEAIAQRILSPYHQERLQTKLEVDVAWQAAGVGRIRASVFKQRGTIAISMRLIPATVPSLERLGLPPSVVKLASETRGLVLVTGVTGSGKSTTLAAIIDLINRTRREHILTIEDPIEFVHQDQMAVITQREIGFDTPAYAGGLRSALRQDPDIILIGEMRDPETIETALTAAETGHLVFSTLHTLNATETINRIVGAFPPHQQEQIRHQIASVIKAAISQRLLPRADGAGRVLAAEVLIATAYIKDCIIDPDKTSLIHDAIVAGGSQYGMQTFDQHIIRLVADEIVTVDEAMRWVTNVEEFKMRLGGITTGTSTASMSAAMAAAGEKSDIERFGS
ncbi:MAG: type IV pilus twitching motility protein PilT [Vicinamibacterales bacterium]